MKGEEGKKSGGESVWAALEPARASADAVRGVARPVAGEHRRVRLRFGEHHRRMDIRIEEMVALAQAAAAAATAATASRRTVQKVHLQVTTIGRCGSGREHRRVDERRPVRLREHRRVPIRAVVPCGARSCSCSTSSSRAIVIVIIFVVIIRGVVAAPRAIVHSRATAAVGRRTARARE